MDELNRILIAALKGEFAMKEPTMEEVLKLVEFDRGEDGGLYVKNVFGGVCGSVIGNVKGDVYGSVIGNIRGNVWGSIEGNVQGSIQGDVWGTVQGKITGREWHFVETPKERAIRLIREGRGEEAIKVLEEE